MLRQRQAARRADVLLLPVPAAGRPVLRRPAVPVRRARPLGDRHRRAAPAAVGHAAAGRRRHPEARSRTPRLAGSCSSASSRCSPASWSWWPRSTPAPGPEIVTWPMLLAGLGVGALASQLGAVTVSSVPDSQSGEIGGLQNTLTNLGASIGTALAGAVLISALTTSFLTGLDDSEAVEQRAHRPGRGRALLRHPVRLRCRPGGGAHRCRGARRHRRCHRRGVRRRPTAGSSRRRERARPHRAHRAALHAPASRGAIGRVLTMRAPRRRPGAGRRRRRTCRPRSSSGR